MSGKNKCRILKEIRKKIAEENDIEFITSECKFKGECSGTCPKCEEELCYLENELKKRKIAGKTIAIAGVAAAILATSAGCSLLNDWLNELMKENVPTGAVGPSYFSQAEDIDDEKLQTISYNTNL